MLSQASISGMHLVPLNIFSKLKTLPHQFLSINNNN